jgi:mycothiol synthase
MRYRSRPADRANDLDRIYDLVAKLPNDALHLTDLPWRLTSPSMAIPDRVRLWEGCDEDGSLVAWAGLQRPSWHCLDYDIRPDKRSEELEDTILAWACTQLTIDSASFDEFDGVLRFYGYARDSDHARIAAFERAGFARMTWGFIQMTRDLTTPIPDSAPSSDFVIRPLAGSPEVAGHVAAHRAAFDTTNMTEGWRQATLRHPHYTPDLDLVAVTPADEIIGFCVSWLTPPLDALGGRRLAQIEPLGVLPAYQRQGVGRALLLESLRRVKNHGVEQMDVEPELTGDARLAYEAVGFRPTHPSPAYLRTFP